MKIMDVLKLCASYRTRIMVAYYPDGYGLDPHKKEERSKIMKIESVTYRKIDHWTFRKEVWKVIPAVDKKGEPYLYIQLQDEREGRK